MKDIYGISVDLVKKISDYIQIPLAFIINKAIERGCSPKLEKKQESFLYTRKAMQMSARTSDLYPFFKTCQRSLRPS